MEKPIKLKAGMFKGRVFLWKIGLANTRYVQLVNRISPGEDGFHRGGSWLRCFFEAPTAFGRPVAPYVAHAQQALALAQTLEDGSDSKGRGQGYHGNLRRAAVCWLVCLFACLMGFR